MAVYWSFLPTSFWVLVPWWKETMTWVSGPSALLNAPNWPLCHANKPYAGEVTLAWAVFTWMCGLKAGVKLWSAISHASYPAMGLFSLQGDFGVGKLNSFPRKSEPWPYSRFTGKVLQAPGGNRGFKPMICLWNSFGPWVLGKFGYRD